MNNNVFFYLCLQALTPFYIFQVFSVTVWYFDEYYYYATCIIFMSLVSLTMSIYQTRQVTHIIAQSKAPIVFLSKKLYPYCSVLVGSRNEFERDFTIKLK